MAALGALGRTWVIEVDGRVLAFATDYRTGTVWAMFVDPAHEGRGFGQALHAAMVNWLWSLGHVSLWLTTDPGTRAERFYLSQGWVPRGMAPGGEIRLELVGPGK